MSKTFLILRQEFRKTVRRGGFIVLTLSLPVVALLGIGIFHIASGTAKPPLPETIGYVVQVGGFSQFTQQGNITLAAYPSADAARQALVNGDISEYFIIPPDFVTKGTVELYTTKKELAPPPATATAIQNFILSNLLAGKVPADVIARVESPLSVTTTTLTATGEVAPTQGNYTNIIIPGRFQPVPGPVPDFQFHLRAAEPR